MKSILAFLKRRNTFTSNRLFVSDAFIKAIAVTSFRLFGFASSSPRYQLHIQPSEKTVFCAQISPFLTFSDIFINFVAG